MLFNRISGIKEIDKEKVKVNYREAVRAVVFNGNNILMVHNNKGDYKFPGGGTNKEENHEQTLKREVREETGYIIDTVKDKLGTFTERKLDEYEENSFFEMISHYYQCEISANRTIQELDDYELELDFQPLWMPLDEAIRLNEEVLNKGENINSWVYRDTYVLKALREYYSNT